MSIPSFSPSLFEQIGGTYWVTRPGCFKEPVSDVEVDTSGENSTSPKGSEEQIIGVIKDKPGKVISGQVEPVLPSVQVSNGDEIVVLGNGLDAVWQNESNQAWLLWQNIMLVFGWDESHVVFYDTSHLASEDMVFTTMEEIIELGVDWVLTMDESHSISELLLEGVQVVTVPDLESMLFDPYAKQAFYKSLVELTPIVLLKNGLPN